MFRQRKYDTRRIDRQYAEETDVYVMLYNSYADALYAYGMGFGFDNETVKDVIHDVFLDIMTRQVDLGRIVNIKAYLFRIVHNRLVDLHRSRVDKCDLSDREPGLRVSLTSLDAMIESEHVLRIRQTIESLLNQLSPKQREALLLRFVYEMEYDDIARISLTPKGEILIDGKENEGAETDRRTPRQEVRVHTSELVVPKGKRAHLQLSDGTRVWINSASVLRFPSAFGDTRDVFVEGEAYFEVAKDANRPFIVHTDHFATRVLGTSFDVTTAPRADGSSAVVLVEGSVAIDVANGESVTLNPSERFSMKDGSYSVYEVDPYKYISWKDGLLFFTSNTLFEVLQKVAAFYKIEITCSGEIGSRKCTGKLILFDDLDGTLDVLSDIFRIAYVRGPDGSVAVRPAPDDCADAVYR